MIFLKANTHGTSFNLRKLFFLFSAIAGFLICQKGIAQNGKGYLMIAVKPSDAIIRLDTSLFKQTQSHFPIDTGSHVIRAWAPKKRLLVDTINISSGTPVLYRKKLENSDEYNAYRKELSAYYDRAFMKKYLPAMVTAGTALYFTGRYLYQKSESEKHLDKCNELKALYDGTTDNDELINYRNSFLEEKEMYDAAVKKTNNTVKQAMIVIPVELAVTGALLYIFRDIKKPHYSETPLLSGIGFNYELSGKIPGPRFSCSYQF